MANGVAVTPQDEALVAGSFRGTADFDPGPGEAVFSGTSDAFLASYAGDGTYRWALVLGSPDGYAEPRALASLPGSRWGMSGELYGAVDFDPGPGEHLLEAAGSNPLVWSDLFVASYTDGGGFPVNVEAEVPWAEVPWAEVPWAEVPWAEVPWAEVPWAEVPWAEVRLTAAPNPARGRVHVTVSVPEAQRVRVEAYDALGRRVAVLHEGPLGVGAHRFALETPRSHRACTSSPWPRRRDRSCAG